MRQYKIFLRSFAPWKSFGGILPQSASGMGGQFGGDDRGFSVDVHSDTTSRVNLQFSVDVVNGILNGIRVWCDPSFGPYSMTGARVADKGKPVARIINFRDGTDFRVTAAYKAANPLVPFAPAIGAQGDYRLRQDASGNMLSIETKISGDQFPACETFVDDGLGHGVFLGGFAPQNKAQILRLYGQMNQPNAIYFWSRVRISLTAHVAFHSVSGAWGDQLSRGLFLPGPAFPIHVWNRGLMRAIALPSDAPAAENSP
jgi:hypothetical protein